MRIDISQAQERIVDAPMRVLAYGPEGVGKSTLASGATKALFLDPTGSTDTIRVARVPRPDDGFAWSDIFTVVEQLATTEHGYQTLVLDELGALESLCWDHITKRDGKKNIEAYGYGKGYQVAVDEWRRLLSWLDRLRSKKGMAILMLGHSHIRTFANPEGPDFDRHEIKLHNKLAGVLKEWHDAVLFCRYETFSSETDDQRKAKGISTGERVVMTTHAAAFDAKNRYDLPPQLPMPRYHAWQVLTEAIEMARGASEVAA